MKEVWKKIKGYAGVYEVSNTGKVRRAIASPKAQARLIGSKTPSCEYQVVTLCKNKVKEKYTVHRLVALYFLGPPSKDRPSINHKNGNKYDNRVQNLEWCSNKENTTHAIKNGLFKIVGKDHWKARLTEKDIKDIRSKYKQVSGKYQKSYTQQMIADEYSITQPAISEIIRRVRWNHI